MTRASTAVRITPSQRRPAGQVVTLGSSESGVRQQVSRQRTSGYPLRHPLPRLTSLTSADDTRSEKSEASGSSGPSPGNPREHEFPAGGRSTHFRPGATHGHPVRAGTAETSRWTTTTCQPPFRPPHGKKLAGGGDHPSSGPGYTRHVIAKPPISALKRHRSNPRTHVTRVTSPSSAGRYGI